MQPCDKPNLCEMNNVQWCWNCRGSKCILDLWGSISGKQYHHDIRLVAFPELSIILLYQEWNLKSKDAVVILKALLCLLMICVTIIMRCFYSFPHWCNTLSKKSVSSERHYCNRWLNRMGTAMPLLSKSILCPCSFKCFVRTLKQTCTQAVGLS